MSGLVTLSAFMSINFHVSVFMSAHDGTIKVIEQWPILVTYGIHVLRKGTKLPPYPADRVLRNTFYEIFSLVLNYHTLA